MSSTSKANDTRFRSYSGLSDFAKSSSQRALAVGRILRTHLLVEQALRQQLGAFNPNLGDPEDLGLSFDKLRRAVRNLKEGATGAIDQPATDLNRLRNRIAHKVDCNLVGDDLRRLAEWVGSVTDDDPTELATDPARCTEAAAACIALFLAAGRVAHRHLQSLHEQQRALDAAFAQSMKGFLDTED